MAAPPNISTANTAPPRAAGPARGRHIALAALLVMAVIAAGWRTLDAPWLPGDEAIFIVTNADVSGGPGQPNLPARLGRIATTIHEDLYQPLPLMSYALEWALGGGVPWLTRLDDLLIHAANALLAWWVLTLLLRRDAAVPPTENAAAPALATNIAWVLSFLWAMHPALVSAWAADMGRTHLLSATFALLAFGTHMLSLRPRRAWWFGVSLLALAAAMACKPIPGYFLVAAAIEFARAGRATPALCIRATILAAICAAFAALAYWTSRQSGLIEDAAAGLFGDPLSRSALAVWIYARSLFAPLWLSTWYLPDPRTSWGNPAVLLGTALTLLTLFHLAAAARRPAARTVAVGWVWFWAFLLPVIGLVGAREAAAADRYLYLPALGVALVIGSILVRFWPRLASGTAPRALTVTVAALGFVMLLADTALARMQRSTLERRRRPVELNPGDPRALEGLAAAYNYLRTHAALPDEFPEAADAAAQYELCTQRFRDTLMQAATTPDLPRWFPGPEDRAPFHRRLAYGFYQCGDFRASLAEAQRARELQPDAYLTWKRLAHAYRGLGDLAASRAAYERAEQLLPDNAETRAIHLADFGTLLLYGLNDPSAAMPKFRAALDSGVAQARTAAMVGLGVCEVRAGLGERGRELLFDALAEAPSDRRALLGVGEYFLRSHDWPKARTVYQGLLTANPLDYDALRGLHEVCVNTGAWREAAVAWEEARRQAPGRVEFESFLVWTMACLGEPGARGAADALLQREADSPFACYARMLLDAREGKYRDALTWAGRARRGRPIAEGRELARAINAVRLMVDRAELKPDARVVLAAMLRDSGAADEARRALEAVTAESADSEAISVARELLAGGSDARTAP